ncbi:hypothetical protein JRQ81_001866, partial [Phrynocephalus forsythii]
GPPDVLVIYLCGKDLIRKPGKVLILQIVDDLNKFASVFPKTRIVWSALIPHLQWKSSHDPQRGDKAHRGVNREIARF